MILRKQTGNFNHCISCIAHKIVALSSAWSHKTWTHFTGGFLFAICLLCGKQSKHNVAAPSQGIPRSTQRPCESEVLRQPRQDSAAAGRLHLPAPAAPALPQRYLGHGGQRWQPGPLARGARAAEGAAQEPLVGVTAAQHVQGTGNGVATPVRDTCQEWHRETNPHKLPAECPERARDTWVRMEKPEPKDNSDHPVQKLVRAAHLSLTGNFISCWCKTEF